MKYTNIATSSTPALVIFLIDISGSMEERFEDGTRLNYVNDAVAQGLSGLIMRSVRGESIAPRYRIAMAAYSDQVLDLLGGIRSIDVVAERGEPTLRSTYGRAISNSCAAFQWALGLLRGELPNMVGVPAPVIFHFTDGAFSPHLGDPARVAAEIMSMGNEDGNVLIANFFAGPDFTIAPIASMESWPGILNESELKSEDAKQLYHMSSLLPYSYSMRLEDEDYTLRRGSKMLFPVNSGALIEIVAPREFPIEVFRD